MTKHGFHHWPARVGSIDHLQGLEGEVRPAITTLVLGGWVGTRVTKMLRYCDNGLSLFEENGVALSSFDRKNKLECFPIILINSLL